MIGEARVKCRMILDIERNLGEAVAKDRVVEAAGTAGVGFKLTKRVLGQIRCADKPARS